MNVIQVNQKMVMIVLVLFLVPLNYCYGKPSTKKLNPNVNKPGAQYSSFRSTRDTGHLKNVSRPEQIHIAFGDYANDITIVWSTQENVRGYVECMNQSGISKRVLGVGKSMTKHDGKNALKYIHRAELIDLKPSTTYTYRIIVGDAETGFTTDKMKFTVPHEDPKAKHTFMVLADMGVHAIRPLHFATHEAVSGKYEAIFHIGDFAYNLQSGQGSVGDDFMKQVEMFASKVPYMTTPGDHEIERGSLTPFYEYTHRFSMPNNDWPMSKDSLWYSIDIGQAHFISIATEYFLFFPKLRSAHFDWLKADLVKANKNRKKTPWIIIMGHQPLYCSRSVMEVDCAGEKSILRTLLENLLYEQGVDLYLSGHKHSYERTWPMYGNRAFQTDYINPMAPVYIVNGAMGYSVMRDNILTSHHWLPFATAKGLELYARLHILNETHLLWSARASETNEEIDSIQIIQNNHGSFGKAGPDAFSKIQYQHAARVAASNLPKEPFIIVDSPPTTFQKYRTFAMYFTVFILFFILYVFLRQSKMLRMMKL